jgi:hypothetical protein
VKGRGAARKGDRVLRPGHRRDRLLEAPDQRPLRQPAALEHLRHGRDVGIIHLVARVRQELGPDGWSPVDREDRRGAHRAILALSSSSMEASEFVNNPGQLSGMNA